MTLLKTSHPLYPKIDKGLAIGKYVIVDPMNPDGLIYLAPKDYIQLMKTFLSTETTIVVLFDPYSKEDIQSLLKEKFPKDTVESLSKKSETPFSYKRVVNTFSGRSSLLSALKSSWDERRMISLTNSLELGLLKYFMRMAVPLSLVKTFRDVSSKMVLTSRFLFYICDLHAKHGASYVVNYLKLSQLAISRAVGRQPLGSLRELDPSRHYKRLTRNGLPLFIPSRDRRAIMTGSTRIIRFWLTLFSIYRILESPSIPKLGTITSPSVADDNFMAHLICYFRANAQKLLLPYYRVKWGDLIVSTWVNAWTASPTTKISWQGLYASLYKLEKDFPIIFLAIKEWVSLTQGPQTWKKSIIESLFESYYRIKQAIIDEKEYRLLPNKLRVASGIGYLSCKVEPAGKVRVFAMVDILTQNILRPLHDVLSKILRKMPNDGTFDQEGMVNRASIKASKYQGAYCYDLSAATDTLPILLQEAIIASLFGDNLAALWKTILVGRPYYLPENKPNKAIFKDQPDKLGSEFYYSTGQPMGALSSFNMLGITHHLIVQYCSHMLIKDNPQLHSELLDKNGWCVAYEILGDDIAIFHKDLAVSYLNVMTLIGVPINEKKSVIDTKGNTLELAKRTILNGSDVSAISLKDIMTSAPFAQRVAIADRVTRRGIMSLSMATSILTRFTGEDSLIRSSFMHMSLFFGLYVSGRINLYDVFFLLFLIKKSASVPYGEQYQYKAELASIVSNALESVISNNSNYKQRSDGTVFPYSLYQKHCVEFNVSLFILIRGYSDSMSKNKLLPIEKIGSLKFDYFVQLMCLDYITISRADRLTIFRIFKRLEGLEILDFLTNTREITRYLAKYQYVKLPYGSQINQVWDTLIDRREYDEYYPDREVTGLEVLDVGELHKISNKFEQFYSDLTIVNGKNISNLNSQYNPLTKYDDIFDLYRKVSVSDEVIVPRIGLTVGQAKEALSNILEAYKFVNLIFFAFEEQEIVIPGFERDKDKPKPKTIPREFVLNRRIFKIDRDSLNWT